MDFTMIVGIPWQKLYMQYGLLGSEQSEAERLPGWKYKGNHDLIYMIIIWFSPTT